MIELKDLDLDDSERLYNWRRQPEVDRWMSQSPPAGARPTAPGWTPSWPTPTGSAG